MTRFFVCLLSCVMIGWVTMNPSQKQTPSDENKKDIQLGNFSVSLAVKDLKSSKEFYEKLGFKAVHGDEKQNWLILQNETATIGLFQGMFPSNILTFNPGWDRNAQSLESFDDVRGIQQILKERGLTLTTSADESSRGPASCTLTDPDGNVILIDQHVPKP